MRAVVPSAGRLVISKSSVTDDLAVGGPGLLLACRLPMGEEGMGWDGMGWDACGSSGADGVLGPQLRGLAAPPGGVRCVWGEICVRGVRCAWGEMCVG